MLMPVGRLAVLRAVPQRIFSRYQLYCRAWFARPLGGAEFGRHWLVGITPAGIGFSYQSADLRHRLLAFSTLSARFSIKRASTF